MHAASCHCIAGRWRVEGQSSSFLLLSLPTLLCLPTLQLGTQTSLAAHVRGTLGAHTSFAGAALRGMCSWEWRALAPGLAPAPQVSSRGFVSAAWFAWRAHTSNTCTLWRCICSSPQGRCRIALAGGAARPCLQWPACHFWHTSAHPSLPPALCLLLIASRSPLPAPCRRACKHWIPEALDR